MEILISFYLLLKEDFHKNKVKEKKFVNYNLIETQFCGKQSFSGKCIAIEIYTNLGLT